jgi:hypothetical protein
MVQTDSAQLIKCAHPLSSTQEQQHANRFPAHAALDSTSVLMVQVVNVLRILCAHQVNSTRELLRANLCPAVVPQVHINAVTDQLVSALQPRCVRTTSSVRVQLPAWMPLSQQNVPAIKAPINVMTAPLDNVQPILFALPPHLTRPLPLARRLPAHAVWVSTSAMMDPLVYVQLIRCARTASL